MNEIRRENFFNFYERLEKAKKDPDFARIYNWTKKQPAVHTPQEYDPDLEALTNYLLWKTGDLIIDPQDLND